MIYRYIYKITCTAGSLKDKFYFGQHTTENLNDNYKGSGTILRNYYKKYPKDYIKDIIGFYNSQESLNKAEYDIIKYWLNNSMCLNLRDGGMCGTISDVSKKKMSTSRTGHIVSYNTRKKLSEKLKGLTLPDERKKRISETLKGNTPWNKGIKMPHNFSNKCSNTKKGNKWLNDGIKEYFCQPEYWGELIDIGFKFGRTYHK